MKKSSEFRVQSSGFPPRRTSRLQTTDYRPQATGVRWQRTEDRGQGTEDRCRIAPWYIAFAGILLSVISLPSSGNAEPQSVDGVRASLEKWVETRKVISHEKRDWALGREMLNERIDLVQQEIDSLREKIADAEESISDADKKRAGLVEENEALKEAAAGLEEMLTSLELRTRSLLVRLPDPIRERVKPLSQRLPENPGDTKLSFTERFQNVIGILNEVNKFNREISVTSEIRTLADGSTAEVTALYIGIGQGYYVSGDGAVAGMGSVGSEGWEWTPANSAAQEIAKTIAILKNEEIAAFVQLPVEVR
jgi:FtsZ-binding cell division protein ZapB